MKVGDKHLQLAFTSYSIAWWGVLIAHASFVSSSLFMLRSSVVVKIVRMGMLLAVNAPEGAEGT